MNLTSVIARLGQDSDAIANQALANAATHLADQLRGAFSTSPGGPHDHPWRRSGALQESIEINAEGPTAVVASTSPTALFQEHGTATIPPRPTFAPIAAAAGQEIAQHIAASVFNALRGP